MEKFIAIYKDLKNAEPVVRDSLSSIYAFENLENKIIASWLHDKNNMPIYKLFPDQGLCFYNDKKVKTKFIIPNKYELVALEEYREKHTSKPIIVFRFEDLSTKNEVKIQTSDWDAAKLLDRAIKEILFASKFDSWDEYLADKKQKDENKLLKDENVKLKKELEQLKKK